MKITTPEQMSSGITNVETAVKAFEKKFAAEEKDCPFYHLVISGELNRETCNQVEELYKDAGWARAKCITSSENGERPGLTGLQLFKYQTPSC